MPHGIAGTVRTGDTAQYYIDTGTTSHLINEVGSTHNYVPCKAPEPLARLRIGQSRLRVSNTRVHYLYRWEVLC